MENSNIDNIEYATRFTNADIVRERLTVPSLYEQLAEECSELAQACLKKSRKLRGENYTPKTSDEIDADVIEELTDVLLVSDILHLHGDYDLYKYKLQRWVDRACLDKDHMELSKKAM